MMENIIPVKIYDSRTHTTLSLSFSNPRLQYPLKNSSSKTKLNKLYPFECKQAKISYTGKLEADVCLQYNDRAVVRESINLGDFPIMLKSSRCHLQGADPKNLVSLREESAELGGYFILNGLERVARPVLMPKANYPTGIVRKSFCTRHDGFTDKAVQIRCVREFQSSLTDQSAVTVKLYYLHNGSARLGFWMQNYEYLFPVGIFLKAFIQTSDREIYQQLTSCCSDGHEKGKGAVGSQLVGERAKIIIEEVRDMSLFTQDDCLRHIGDCFKPVMDGLENDTTLNVGHAVLKNYILVHLTNLDDKFNLLIFMLQKLFSLVDQTSASDNPDALQIQEILLPGHIITISLKEKLEDMLINAKKIIQEEIAKNNKFSFLSVKDIKKLIDRAKGSNFCSHVENTIKTGRLSTRTGLDMQERAGFTVQADRLNYLRFLSFFRSVHRGTTFAGLRTTSVRKLLPESWGFLCPVHTPDGEPCGLLNHMTHCCRVTSFFDSKGAVKDFFEIRKSILGVLTGLGMASSLPRISRVSPPQALSVLLDGRVVGSINSSNVEQVVSSLRRLKVSATSMIPDDLEVGYVPISLGGAYPGLYLFTSPSRFIRPVRNLSIPPEDGRDIELIGPFEQVFMEIRCQDGGNGGRNDAFPATHEEIHPTAMLSVVANLTPWSDHNQSPRNMYQCQTPQTPIVRTSTYLKYGIDEYATGTNAIVAVLAYTGYDMEDAMILNKSSVERGMCYGTMYKTETIDLAKPKTPGQMCMRSSDTAERKFLDVDGLPFVGQILHPGDPICNIGTKRHRQKQDTETSYVDNVDVDTKKGSQKVNIRCRHPRPPIIGDKFSSRHGQKGVCSQLWPDIDMPFSGVTGMRPDLIINPHAFPSRMTIGMLLESLAAKGASLNGKFVDATPFASSMKKKGDRGGKTESESKSLVDDLGEALKSHGFNYHGSEVLYSGVHGTEFTCEIFIGPVYYQRLRHMVSDKFQVRSTGTIDPITRQPIKGRKHHGGVRFGEMERDAMIAHGASYLLHDRLHTCSDYHVADVCSICGSVLTATFIQPSKRLVKLKGQNPKKKVACLACKTSNEMQTVAMPYVFKYLAAELAAMNIKITLNLTN
ncbi:DNA-directed RNA polymerase I subunit 2 [Linum perenne]